MIDTLDISWHRQFAQQWLDRHSQGRLPHAVVLAGPRGVGKRAAAAWMAAQKLGIEPLHAVAQYPWKRPEHADLHWIDKLEDKKTILIDQVRDLVNDLSLTSYEGRGKVAVIEPADIMTVEAANSLLKTLEEPPGDTLLILVTDRTGQLPPTVFSRCQRIDIRVPGEREGLTWLDKLRPGSAWLEPLRIANFAPLAAIEAAESLETSGAMARDFANIIDGKASPIEVAANWSKIEPMFVLNWLSRQTQLAIRALQGGSGDGHGLAISESVLQRIDRRNLFCYLETVNRLRGQRGGSWNVQLTFEGLLMDWATELNTQVMK